MDAFVQNHHSLQPCQPEGQNDYQMMVEKTPETADHHLDDSLTLQ